MHEDIFKQDINAREVAKFLNTIITAGMVEQTINNEEREAIRNQVQNYMQQVLFVDK